MFNFVLKRLAIAVPTILILIVLSFMLMFAAPGGPFNSERLLPPQVLANLEARYGLDQPYWKQMYDYVYNFAKEQGFYNITLNVWSLNEPAMKFYEACGLKPQKVGMETIL